MGLLFPDDPHYDETQRQTGFDRYRQLLSVRFGQWWKNNLLALAGFAPLAAGIACAITTSSLLVLLPCCLLGGMIAGPFLAGMYDAILRGLRDDPLPWREGFRRSWRQNWKGSLLPGALLGLTLGVYAFMAMLFWWARQAPSPGTIALYLFALLAVLILNTLYWPQLVLFEQKTSVRLRNCLLFCIKYFWRTLGVGLLQLAYWTLFVLFAPWTLLLLPVLGVWYILFLSQLLLYGPLDRELHIEEQFARADRRGA